ANTSRSCWRGRSIPRCSTAPGSIAGSRSAGSSARATRSRRSTTERRIGAWRDLSPSHAQVIARSARRKPPSLASPGGGGPQGGTEPCSERASCLSPPPLQSVRRLPLPQPLRRRVAAADTVAVDTVVVDTAADTAGWARMLVWPRMAEWEGTPWVGDSPAADSAAVDSQWLGTAGGGGLPALGGRVHASPPGFAAFSSTGGPPHPPPRPSTPASGSRG